MGVCQDAVHAKEVISGASHWTAKARRLVGWKVSFLKLLFFMVKGQLSDSFETWDPDGRLWHDKVVDILLVTAGSSL